MKRMLGTMVWLGICAALVGCTTKRHRRAGDGFPPCGPVFLRVGPGVFRGPRRIRRGISLSVGKALFRLPRKRSSFRFTTERTRNSAMGKRIGWSALGQRQMGRCSNISRIRRGTTSGSSRPLHSQSEHRIHPVNYYGKEALTQGHYRYGEYV